MAGLLDRLGRTTARPLVLTIVVWLVLAAGIVSAAVASGGATVDNFSIPGAQSQRAADLLAERFPALSGDTASVVFVARTGALSDASNAAAIEETQANLAKLPHVADTPTAVVGPATPVVGDQFVSANGKIGYTSVQYDVAATELDDDAFEQLEQAAAPAVAAGLRVEYGGPVVDYGNQVASTDGDLIGLGVAVIILLLAFGSVVAMSLPIGTALFGLASVSRSSPSSRRRPRSAASRRRWRR